MTRTLSLLVICLLLAGCRRQAVDPQRPTSANAAEQMSRLAVDPKQAELWKQAAQAPSVELPLRSDVQALSVRQKTKPGEAFVAKAQTTPATIAGAQPSGIQLLSLSELPDGTYTGSATIKRIEGERLELDFARGRAISLLVRLRGASLQAKPGEAVQIDIRTRQADPRDRMEVVALRTQSGDGVVSVLEGSTKPVTVRIPIYDFTASQIGSPDADTMAIEVVIGKERQIVRQGQIADFKSANLRVGVVASLAVTGDRVFREEGNPYSVRLLAWRP